MLSHCLQKQNFRVRELSFLIGFLFKMLHFYNFRSQINLFGELSIFRRRKFRISGLDFRSKMVIFEILVTIDGTFSWAVISNCLFSIQNAIFLGFSSENDPFFEKLWNFWCRKFRISGLDGVFLFWFYMSQYWTLTLVFDWLLPIRTHFVIFGILNQPNRKWSVSF